MCIYANLYFSFADMYQIDVETILNIDPRESIYFGTNVVYLYAQLISIDSTGSEALIGSLDQKSQTWVDFGPLATFDGVEGDFVKLTGEWNAYRKLIVLKTEPSDPKTLQDPTSQRRIAKGIKLMLKMAKIRAQSH